LCKGLQGLLLMRARVVQSLVDLFGYSTGIGESEINSRGSNACRSVISCAHSCCEIMTDPNTAQIVILLFLPSSRPQSFVCCRHRTFFHYGKQDKGQTREVSFCGNYCLRLRLLASVQSLYTVGLFVNNTLSPSRVIRYSRLMIWRFVLLVVCLIRYELGE
jgi:hypothetical protein